MSQEKSTRKGGTKGKVEGSDIMERARSIKEAARRYDYDTRLEVLLATRLDDPDRLAELVRQAEEKGEENPDLTFIFEFSPPGSLTEEQQARVVKALATLRGDPPLLEDDADG